MEVYIMPDTKTTTDTVKTTLSYEEELQAENDALKTIISDMKDSQESLRSEITQKALEIAYLKGLLEGIGGKRVSCQIK